MNNIFVLCTGRCGSKTFSNACGHATNYSVGHETVWLRRGLAYPDDHIEINNRLVWYMGLLREKFPYARYVYLYRNKGDVARSYMHRTGAEFSLMRAWRNAIRMGWFSQRSKDPEREPYEDALEMVTAINTNIEVFMETLADWQKVFVDIERPDTFKRFWERMGLKGDMDAAIETFCKRCGQSREGRKRRAK